MPYQDVFSIFICTKFKRNVCCLKLIAPIAYQYSKTVFCNEVFYLVKVLVTKMTGNMHKVYLFANSTISLTSTTCFSYPLIVALIMASPTSFSEQKKLGITERKNGYIQFT